MPAAAVLTDDIKREIAKIYLEDKTVPAKVVLDKVHERLGRTDWPKLSVIQREIKKIRDNDTSQTQHGGSLESPWHMGLTLKYNIPPEAVSYILMVQQHADSTLDMFKQPHKPLSVRQTLWVARLYGIISINPLKKKKDFEKLLLSIAHYLYQWSEAYATREHICELSGTNFDTSNLDKMLLAGGEPITVQKTTIAFYRNDNSLEIDTVDDKLLQQMEKMEKDGDAK